MLNAPTVVHADEQPITYRIHYSLNDTVENGGVPSYTDIAPYKEGVIIIEVAPHIDGYVVDGANSISITYDYVTGDNVWHDEDWYPADGFLLRLTLQAHPPNYRFSSLRLLMSLGSLLMAT